MEQEFWIRGDGDTGLPVLYTKNHVIAVIKRIHNQHPLEAVEPMISRTFKSPVIHEARNSLFKEVTHYRGAIKDDHGNVPATRRCPKLAVKDIMMILEDVMDKLIIIPVVEWKDLDTIYNYCKGTSVPIEEETRVGGPLSFKVQEIEKHITTLVKNMDSFRRNAETMWSLEEARRKDGAGAGGAGAVGARGPGAPPTFGTVAAGSGERGGMGRGGRQVIPGLHLNGAPVGAQQLVTQLEVQEVGREEAGWTYVPGNRRTRTRSPQTKRDAEAMDGQGEKIKNRPRTQAKFGTRVVEIEGAEAAPVSFFIGNTNPKSVKETISKVIIQCAKETNGSILKEGDIEVVSMTRVENPRTKCWKLTVPNKWRETFRDDEFWPMGWSHRPWVHRSSGNGKDSTKKPRTESQSANEVVVEVNTPTQDAQELHM